MDKNWKAVDATDAALKEIAVPSKLPGKAVAVKRLVPDNSDAFTRTIIAPIMREQGDNIKVSEMPYDGCIPCGTTCLEKRGVAPFVPAWNADKCIQCNQCAFVCPHAAVRAKLIEPKVLADLSNKVPATFKTVLAKGKDKDFQYKVQIYPEDCIGCADCVNECPSDALTLVSIDESRKQGETQNAEFFNSLPSDVLGSNKEDTVKGSQFKQPLLEFSGACGGCGETPYIKLITQLFGDRMIIANATGCSSIWGGTFPTVPYCKNKDGHGPAWANSLFEDNAEYGLGMRLAVDSNRRLLKSAVTALLADGAANLDGELKSALNFSLENFESVEENAKQNAARVKELLPMALKKVASNSAAEKTLRKIVELDNYFVPKSVWALGGDGWAYDIGFGGLDHTLATGRNINIFVLDTEVYSNTGGQASKSSPLGAVAKFAEAGKNTVKKDLGLMLMSYGYIYVASVSMGANKVQLLKALKEAEAYNGPSIVIAYAPCINHGIDMSRSQAREKLAVESGYWLLYRYNPALKAEGKNPLVLDSKEPKFPVNDFLKDETRYTSLERSFPERSASFRQRFDGYVKDRYLFYKRLASEQ
ncbi:MAG: 4Fe-4S dicluster domain-containing protein [Oligoflexia bacterium]|nr:4Fe-4S dicluster domain-containing protein [Oligoflexia bacterium]